MNYGDGNQTIQAECYHDGIEQLALAQIARARAREELIDFKQLEVDVDLRVIEILEKRNRLKAATPVAPFSEIIEQVCIEQGALVLNLPAEKP